MNLMTRFFSGLLIVSLLFLLFAFQSKPASTSSKSQVMILGTYHMNNPGMDVYNLESDDVLAEKRQKEIKALADILAKFKPTKIAIERRWQTKYDTLTQQRYLNYKNGSHELSRGEDQQIGFRLAKQLGHDRIYCIDAPGQFEFNTMVEYANKNGQGAFFEEANKMMTKYMEEQNVFLKENTVSDILKAYNEPKKLKADNGMYASFLQIGKNKDYPGADLVSDWYERNLRIFSNLTRITQENDDRVLVIFGAGHAPILREMVDYYPDYELVEVGDYLK